VSAAPRADASEVVGARLAAALGADRVATHAPLALEGARVELSVRPQSAEECAAALRELAAARTPVLVRGSGSRLEAANAPCRARVLLDMRALRAAPELDLDEGVARFAAGTKLAEIEALLEPTLWRLPLDPPEPGSTLGGALASAALGPRFGSPRDVVLGLSFALASGALAKSGGRVVKNVTGYDLNKLLVGSRGELAVITAAWLRLRPRPEHTELWIAPAPQDGALALAAARAYSARVAALVDASLAPAACALVAAPRAFVVELAGDAAAVAIDRSALASRLGAVPAASGVLAELRAAQAAGPARLRVAVLPSAVGALQAALAASGARTLALPGRGVVWAVFKEDAAEDVDAFATHLDAVRAATRAAAGVWCVEAAPAALRAGREVCGDPGDTLALQRAVKRSYDPDGILNPGRGLGES
jgi:glycolate oxidase FAD binding subunit